MNARVMARMTAGNAPTKQAVVSVTHHDVDSDLSIVKQASGVFRV